MQATIDAGHINGSINAPSSKSITQRVFAAALLHKGKTLIFNAGSSDDEMAALHIIQQLGANIIAKTKDIIEILSDGVHPVSDHISCGESGLSARLFTPIAALSDRAITIEGAGSLLHRPMHGFNEMLSLLGVAVGAFNGYLPVTIRGPLQAKPIQLNAGNSSQLLSGLLFAYSHSVKEPIVVEVAGLKSTPYIDLTLEVLQHFGRTVTHENYRLFHISPSSFTNTDTIEINIEGDWSSAAYLLVAGAISGTVTVKNLNVNSKQADRAILELLRDVGARVVADNNSVSISRLALRAFDFNATHCPDLFPILAILAACCEGESAITGIHRLFHKESNRAESISEMLENFSVPFSLEDDSLCITGVRKLQGTVIDSYRDHRIAMAAAVGALRAGGPVDIGHAESVNKSYPGFFADLASCGIPCKLSAI